MRRSKRIVITLVVAALMLAWIVPVPAADGDRVNINTADYEELMTLERVGESYAKRIVAYREKNGSFQKAEDLLMVRGIGPKILEVNVGRIVVTDQ